MPLRKIFGSVPGGSVGLSEVRDVGKGKTMLVITRMGSKCVKESCKCLRHVEISLWD